MQREQPEEIPNDVFDNVDGDLDRIELWTAALGCFQYPAPQYQPDSVMSDERRGMARSILNEARDPTADIANPLKGAAEDLCRQKQRRSVGTSMKAARNTASSLGEVVRKQPYTALAIALGLGWLLGRMDRPL
jgi:ElaB/YqjD/DUF883 family membrane-anchored ribosome-binding protein